MLKNLITFDEIYEITPPEAPPTRYLPNGNFRLKRYVSSHSGTLAMKKLLLGWILLALLLLSAPVQAIQEENSGIDEDQSKIINDLLDEQVSKPESSEEQGIPENERNKDPTAFDYIILSTYVPQGFKSLPKKDVVTSRGRRVAQVKDCKVPLVLDLMDLDKMQATFCLFQKPLESPTISPVRQKIPSHSGPSLRKKSGFLKLRMRWW